MGAETNEPPTNAIDSNALLEKLEELQLVYKTKESKAEGQCAKLVENGKWLAVTNCIIIAQGLMMKELSNDHRSLAGRSENELPRSEA